MLAFSQFSQKVVCRGMRAIFKLFDLDTSDPELMRAQFRAFQGHIPLLYGILVCNTVAITVTAFNPQQLTKTLFSPIAISAIAITRSIWWLRQGNAEQFGDAEISKHLKRTCNLAVLMTLTFNAWVIWVFRMPAPMPAAI
jgi:predicted signal transduction protein with EAL and GGDEF domain